MKIISPFKDYYDHVSYLAGGAPPDNAVLYLRKPATPKSFRDHPDLQDLAFAARQVLTPLETRLILKLGDALRGIRTFLLVLGESVYPIIRLYKDDGEPVASFASLDALQAYIAREPSSIQNRYVQDQLDQLKKELERPKAHLEYPPTHGQYKTDSEVRAGLAKLCEVYDSPVVLLGHFSLELNPNMGELGMGQVLEPGEAYQRIEWFIDNTLRKPRLPVELTDKERIVQHGFDTKVSFRHRKAS